MPTPTPESCLALRLAITIIDRQCASTAETVADGNVLSDPASPPKDMHEVFDSLIDEAKRRGQPLVNSIGAHHSSQSLVQSLTSFVHQRLRRGKGNCFQILRHYGSASIQVDRWDKLCEKAGTWGQSIVKEESLLDAVCPVLVKDENSLHQNSPNLETSGSAGSLRLSSRQTKRFAPSPPPTEASASTPTQSETPKASTNTHDESPERRIYTSPTVVVPAKRKLDLNQSLTSTPKQQMSRPSFSPIASKHVAQSSARIECREEQPQVSTDKAPSPDPLALNSVFEDAQSWQIQTESPSEVTISESLEASNTTDRILNRLRYPFQHIVFPYPNGNNLEKIGSTDLEEMAFFTQWQQLPKDINTLALRYTAKVAGKRTKLFLSQYKHGSLDRIAGNVFGYGHSPRPETPLDDLLCAMIGLFLFEKIFWPSLDLYSTERSPSLIETLEAHGQDVDRILREVAYRRVTSLQFEQNELESLARRLSTSFINEELRYLLDEIRRRGNMYSEADAVEIVSEDLKKVIFNALRLKVRLDLSPRTIEAFWVTPLGHPCEFPCAKARVMSSNEQQPTGIYHIDMSLFPGLVMEDEGQVRYFDKAIVLVGEMAVR